MYYGLQIYCIKTRAFRFTILLCSVSIVEIKDLKKLYFFFTSMASLHCLLYKTENTQQWLHCIFPQFVAKTLNLCVFRISKIQHSSLDSRYMIFFAMLNSNNNNNNIFPTLYNNNSRHDKHYQSHGPISLGHNHIYLIFILYSSFLDIFQHF